MTDDLNLLPTPQFIARHRERLLLARNCTLQIVIGTQSHPKVQVAARMIQDQLELAQGGLSSRVSVAQQQTEADGWILLLDLEKHRPFPAELDQADRQAIAASCRQGYVLKIQQSRTVCIWGFPQGVLWGAMTLLQLLKPDESGVSIPGLHIRDYPHFEFRCVADWLINAEANRSSMDRGQGWQGYEDVCKQKIDQCLRYKINAILFDGFGWGLSQRPAEYPAVVRRISRYARQRGIHLAFGGYGAGYGMAFQKGPLYEDAAYLGEVFKNQADYPAGQVYPCTGETRAHAVRKGVDTRILGTCRGNDSLNRLKANELQQFVRAVEPGMLYIHHEDYGSCRNTQAAWLSRCQRCRQRWPNDDVAAVDGAAGAVAEGYTWLIRAVNEVESPETGYAAARDCQILLVSPVYCLSDRTSESWDTTLRFWQSAARQLPDASNVMACFRETFALDGDRRSWAESFNAAMRDIGSSLGAIVFFITGGDHWLNDYPFVGGCTMDSLFLGARGILHDNGNAYQEPLQLLNAEYSWNTRSTGYAPAPDTYQQTWDLWIGLSDNEITPDEIHGHNGLLHRACAKLYGDQAADTMAEYFTTFRTLHQEQDGSQAIETHQDAAPQRNAYLPMTSNRVHAAGVLWKALALDSKTWPASIGNERMLQEMARLDIDRPELHRRLIRRWATTYEMLKSGEGLLTQALRRATCESVRRELQFLLDATQVKLPLALALASFHRGLSEILSGEPDRRQAALHLESAQAHAERAATLAQHHYLSVVDPVAEPGAVRTYLARLETAIRERLTWLARGR